MKCLNDLCDCCKIENIEEKIKKLYDTLNYDRQEIFTRIKRLEGNYIMQLEENRKLSMRIDELNISSKSNVLDNPKISKCHDHHKCHKCNGQGGTVISGMIDEYCPVCKGKAYICV